MMKTVFISSTYDDLADYRRAIWQVLKEFDVNIRGMEAFGARTEHPLQTCLAEVEQSDVYLGIVAFRLGTMEPSSEKSFTQLEYEHALGLKKEILIYLADENQAIFPYKDIDVDSKPLERLKAFKSILQERHTVNRFSNPEDLADKLRRDFKRYFKPSELENEPIKNEFDKTLALVKDFLLMPKSVLGREARFKISFFGDPYPASRALCKAFRLDYGLTIGIYITVDLPKLDRNSLPFRELFATGQKANAILELIKKKKPIDIYARLQFTEQDIKSTSGEFFGYTHYFSPDDIPDPNETYIPPEGKAILLFSKLA